MRTQINFIKNLRKFHSKFDKNLKKIPKKNFYHKYSHYWNPNLNSFKIINNNPELKLIHINSLKQNVISNQINFEYN